ncbi:hypothetical protein [Bacillus massilinigeriensis]|uniref:hypothetical protein n=1 Tax=Bacillus massilionigeriensis TaxID=1805475 RepID=UPI00096AE8B9|nr:hypothetical protein [Bacillus massilionigeriensis]
MLGWALTILFGISAALLIYSLVQIKQSSNKEQREIDSIYFSMMEEISKLQNHIRNLELDVEIISQNTENKAISNEERALLRELLDLYKRGYSVQSIAGEKNMNEVEVEQILAPYKASKKERSATVNER